MDTSPRLYFRYVWCLFVVCCEICRGNLIATNVTGYGGNKTVFTCSSPDISPGDSYSLRKGGIPIYRASDEGTTLDGKYNATAEDGKINLNILVTNISDAGEYTCNHDFTDASGTVSVAFQPKKVTATTSQQEHIRRLSVSAYKVFPREANISNVSCLRPDNTVAVFQRENQVVNTNNEEQYLYDIFWNGTTDKTLSGDVQCNITIVVKDTIVETIDVSFQEPDSTSAPVPVQGHIVGVVVGICLVICFVIFIVMFCRYKKRKPYSRQETYSQPEKKRRKHPRTDTCGTMIGTRPPQTNVQDGYQLKGQSIKTSLPSIVGPDINHHYGDPNKTTAGQQRAVTNERITTRHLTDNSQDRCERGQAGNRHG